MGKEQQVFLDEVINSLAAMQERLARLEKEVALLKGEAVPEPVPSEPIDFGLDPFDMSVTEEPRPEPVPAPAPAVKPEPAPAAPTPAPAPEPEPEPAPAPEPAPVPEPEPAPAVEPEPAPAPAPEPAPAPAAAPEDLPEDDLPEAFADLFPDVHAPSRSLNDAKAASRKVKAVMDVMAEKMAWRTDMPGAEVKDIRSAISLNDRVMFIGTLFREDSMLFQDTVSRLNMMSSLDTAVDYLKSTFPEWKMDSDPVYRFMMAVRRKLR